MVNRYLLSVIFLCALIPFIVQAQDCADDEITVRNLSKFNVQLFLNDVPYTILGPGESLTDQALLRNGGNTLNVKPLTNKGEINTKFKGPKPTNFEVNCADQVSAEASYDNSHFAKIVRKDDHGNKLPPKKPKKIGNKGGAGLNLSGTWTSVSTTNCELFLLDGGDLITGTQTCGNIANLGIEGRRLGGKLTYLGYNAALGLIGGEFGIFSDIVIEDENGNPIKVDILKGFYRVQASGNKADAFKLEFVRLSEED